jgi:hypothetical protein
MVDALLELVQVFKQPDTGAAMNGRYIKGDHYAAIIAIVHQHIGDIPIIEVLEFISKIFAFEAQSGILIQLIIGTQLIFTKDIVYHFAPVATEILIIEPDMLISACIATVIAGDFCMAVDTDTFFSHKP